MFWDGVSRQPWALLPTEKRKMFTSNLGLGEDIFFPKDTAEDCGIKCCCRP